MLKAKEYLSQAFRLDQRINSKIEYVVSLRGLATKATASIHAERVSGTKARSPMENAVVKLIDLEHEINDEIDQLIDLKREIIHVINSVQQTEYHLLLEMRYLSYKTWEEIAEMMNYSYRQVHRVHDQALKSVHKSRSTSFALQVKDGTQCHSMS